MAKGNWFTIVATDLFAGSFAAILIIDAATPKEPYSLGEPTLFQMTFEAGNSGSGIDCRNPHNVLFAFTDDQGDKVLTRDIDLSGSRTGTKCKVTGLIHDVSVNEPPDDARILVVYRPRPPAAPPIGDVSVKISTFPLVCKEGTLCTP